MQKSSLFFGIVAALCVMGAGVLLALQIMRTEVVAAQPLSVAPVSYGKPFVLRTATVPVVKKTQVVVSTAPQSPSKNEVLDEVPQITAASALVVDAKTGEVLYEKDALARRPLASITKLISAITVVDTQPHWVATTTISRAGTLEGREFFYNEDVVTVRDLLFASLIGSSNTATVELADAIMPEHASFVAKMRLKAHDEGLTELKLSDPTGLSPENMGSAWDAVRLLRLAYQRPIIAEAIGSAHHTAKTVNGSPRPISTTNWLLSGQIRQRIGTIVAGKTGYLPEGGFNFVMLTSDESGNEIYVAVLGAETHFARFTEAQALALWAYDNYSWDKK